MRAFWLLFCVIFSSSLVGEEEKKICLNMIVKNESRVIQRCLSSVKGIIDYWVIVDTGSTDGTQKIIQEFMKDIPGKLYERPWVNFGHNREEALQLAKNKGDYILFIDADEVLMGVDKIDKKALKGDGYLVAIQIPGPGDASIQRPLLISNRLDWHWKGVLHERLSATEASCLDFLRQAAISARSSDGARSQDPQKYLKDAKTLETALEKEPSNEQYVYYLAQSYYNAGRYDLALKYYQQRAGMKGWDQEVFWAKYYTGVLQEKLGMPASVFTKSYLEAYQNRQTRAEPLYHLASYYNKHKEPMLAYIFAKFALSIPVPTDLVYVEHWIYSYGILLELAESAFAMEKFAEAKGYYEHLFSRSDVPQGVKEQFNERLFLAKLKSLNAEAQELTAKK